MKKFCDIVKQSSLLVAAANGLLSAELAQAGCGDIAPAHGDILAELFAADGLSVSALARASGRTKSTVSVLVQRLEDNGYVVKRGAADDSRAVGVWLTPRARELEPVFTRISEDLAGRLTAGMASYEAEMLAALLARAVRNFR